MVARNGCAIDFKRMLQCKSLWRPVRPPANLSWHVDIDSTLESNDVRRCDREDMPAFRACVEEGNAQQIMCSYNSIAVRGGSHPYNSTPACLDGDIQNRLV